MKKIALAVLLASGLMAADSGFYVGADVGSTKVKVDTSYSYSNSLYPEYNEASTDSVTDTATTATLKMGYYLNKNNRASVAIQRADFDGITETAVSVGYDYLIGEAALKPFVGAIVGYGKFKPDEGTSFDGNFFGGQAGVNYSVNENFSLEAGIRYMASNIKYSETDISGSDTNVNSGEIKTISNWFVGANYKF